MVEDWRSGGAKEWRKGSKDERKEEGRKEVCDCVQRPGWARYVEPPIRGQGRLADDLSG